MRQAIAAALAHEMELDDTVVVLGEDVAQAGGVFKASEGLLAAFGPLRVRDTPIAEMGFLGAAVGAAATGLRPVVEIMFAEFLGVAIDQISTEAAKLRYLSGGQLAVPLVLRESVGPGLGFGAQHSQTLETWLYATPGLKVVSPSGARSAYGLLRSAIRDDDPVVFLEPRILYGDREEVTTGEDGIIPLGQAAVVQAGTDVTVIALGQTVPTAVQACLGDTGWSAEVIDLQTIVPWDRATVLKSVAKTRRLVIVEANPYSGGWGTEIAAEVSSELFGQLQAPVTRVTTPDAPVPFARPLEERFVPQSTDVRDMVEQLVQTDRRPQAWWQKAAR